MCFSKTVRYIQCPPYVVYSLHFSIYIRLIPDTDVFVDRLFETIKDKSYIVTQTEEPVKIEEISSIKPDDGLDEFNDQ